MSALSRSSRVPSSPDALTLPVLCTSTLVSMAQGEYQGLGEHGRLQAQSLIQALRGLGRKEARGEPGMEGTADSGRQETSSDLVLCWRVLKGP